MKTVLIFLSALLFQVSASAFDSRTTLACSDHVKVEIFDNLGNGIAATQETFALISKASGELLPPGEMDRSRTQYVGPKEFTYTVGSRTGSFSLKDGSLDLKDCIVSKWEAITK